MKALLTCWAVLAAAAAAAGQAADGYDPPAVADTTNWPALVIAVIAAIAIGVCAFKSSRRSHMD